MSFDSKYLAFVLCRITLCVLCMLIGIMSTN